MRIGKNQCIIVHQPTKWYTCPKCGNTWVFNGSEYCSQCCEKIEWVDSVMPPTCSVCGKEISPISEIYSGKCTQCLHEE